MYLNSDFDMMFGFQHLLRLLNYSADINLCLWSICQ